MDSLPDLSLIWQQTLDWQPNTEQKEKFQELYKEIIEGNRQFNLTRITSPRDFWEKHLWDSLAGVISPSIMTEKTLEVIDIGTGAGFPGIPVAIAFPHWQVTLLDSTQKKVNFLNNLCTSLALNNVQAIAARAEELQKQQQYQNHYDLALVRAVGSAHVCTEYALPLVKKGGLAILYRGHWSETENSELTESLSSLSGKIEEIQELTTPLSQSQRHYLWLRKI